MHGLHDPISLQELYAALGKLSTVYKTYGLKEQRAILGVTLFGRLSVLRCPLHNGLWFRWANGADSNGMRRYSTDYYGVSDLLTVINEYRDIRTIETARSQLLVVGKNRIRPNVWVFGPVFCGSFLEKR